DIESLAAARWLLGLFSRKTPGFYARVLHAVVASPKDAQNTLDSFAIVEAAEWTQEEVRVAMFGNYHAKDVVPIQQLLGSNHVWTGLLHEGLHSGISPTDSEFVPTRVFDSWSSARKELGSGISWDRIQPTANVRPSVDPAVLSLLEHAPVYRRFQVVRKLAEFFSN
nr:hypothetical protein [Gemmatimonadota bacterium]